MPAVMRRYRGSRDVADEPLAAGVVDGGGASIAARDSAGPRGVAWPGGTGSQLPGLGLGNVARVSDPAMVVTSPLMLDDTSSAGGLLVMVAKQPLSHTT
ncbi:MAG: hypothetical protein M3Y91_15860 [Actinomycetota bacterium]|nr:hypothetical protein [Actinomycetota bacterium]